MALSDDQISAIAALARLAEPAEPEALRRDLQRILGYFDRLADHDDPRVAPLRHPNVGDATVSPDMLRADVMALGLEPAVLAALAPAWREERFEVPRTVEHD